MNINEQKSLGKLEEKVESSLGQLAIPLSSKEKQFLKEAMIKIEKDQISPREALGWTPEMIEVIYNHGYQLFYAGKYKEAIPVFSTLRELEPADPRYSFAIAACYHRDKDYLDAAANYILSHSLDPLEPLSCFYLYDCFMKANHPISALGAIQEALILAEDPKYRELKPKIELEYQHLKEFLKTYFNKIDAAAASGE